MPNIYSSTGDGWAMSGEEGSWVNARRSSGAVADNNNARDSVTVLIVRDSAKGGGSLAVTRRSFMSFDTSGISVAPSEATLKIRGYSTNNSDIIVVKSTAATTTVAGSFDDLPSGALTAIGLTDGSGAGTLASVSGFTYSAEISSWSVSGYNDIALNSTALDDMASLDTFKICIMDYDYDYLDVDPGAGTNVRIGFYWADNTGTSLDPYIDYTEGTAEAADNSVFFGCNF